MLTLPDFTKENHLVREKMFKTQTRHIYESNRVSAHIHKGIELAELRADQIPNVLELSNRMFKTTWWRFIDAENAYLSHDDRFDHLLKKEFPVTNYIRPLKDIQYTPLPDLFHEYFWHMPQMFQQKFADLEYLTAKLHTQAKTQEQKLAIFNTSRRTIEYGVLREKNTTKAAWAWIISSPWDLQRFSQNKFILEEATLEKLIHTTPSPHKRHTKLFVCEWIEQRRNLLLKYEQNYM